MYIHIRFCYCMNETKQQDIFITVPVCVCVLCVCVCEYMCLRGAVSQRTYHLSPDPDFLLQGIEKRRLKVTPLSAS